MPCDCSAVFFSFEDSKDITDLGVLDTSHMPIVPAMYGMNEIGRLAAHYNMDEDDLQYQWNGFLEDTSNLPASMRCLSSVTKALFGHMHEQVGFQSEYPILKKLASVAMVPAVSTAGVERVFSQVKLIKKYHRNKLTQQTLQYLLRIKLNCPQELFDHILRDFSGIWLAEESRKLCHQSV